MSFLTYVFLYSTISDTRKKGMVINMNEDKDFLSKETIGKLLLRLAIPTVAAQIGNGGAPRASIILTIVMYFGNRTFLMAFNSLGKAISSII